MIPRPTLQRDDMHAYQDDATNWLTYRTGGKLHLGLGLGKTVVTLTALGDAFAIFPGLRNAMIVGPRRVVEETWPQEIDEWAHIDFTYAICTRAKARRLAAIEAFKAGAVQLLFVNYENLTWALSQFSDLDLPGVAVLDELSLLKNHASGRTEAFLERRHQFKRIWGLTATPVARSFEGLWAQEEATYPWTAHNRLGHNITAFRNTYFSKQVMEGFAEYRLDHDAEDRLKVAIASTTLRMDSADYLDLKKPLIVDIELEWPTKKARKIYNTMQKHFVVEMDESLDQFKKVEAVHAGAKSNKLRQIAAGVLYEEVHGEKNVMDIHSAKLDRLEEIVTSLDKDPLLVFVNFKRETERVLERFPDAYTLDSPNAVTRFQQGEIPVMVLHPASGGHGLNLQHACAHAAWLTLPWSLELYLQACGRIDRQGQKRQPRFYRLFMENSIDYLVSHTLDQYDATQESFMQAIKEWRAAVTL